MKLRAPVTLMVVFLASGVAPEAQERIEIPQRRSTRPAPVEFPALPPDADRIASETIEVVLPSGPHVVVRTPARILVSSTNREWLFERNVVDPRRASATVVDHNAKTVIVYGESDVRNVLGINGWAGVLATTSYGSGTSAQGVKVTRVDNAVDSHLLQNPANRFPLYKVFELADWLETR